MVPFHELFGLVFVLAFFHITLVLVQLPNFLVSCSLLHAIEIRFGTKK
jgi:hypothetical protein